MERERIARVAETVLSRTTSRNVETPADVYEADARARAEAQAVLKALNA